MSLWASYVRIGRPLFLIGLFWSVYLQCPLFAQGSREKASRLVAYCPDAGQLVVAREGSDYLKFSLAAWGPNWAWTSLQGPLRSENGAARADLTGRIQGTDVPIRLSWRARHASPKQLVLTYDLSSERSSAITLIAVEFEPGPPFEGQVAVVLTEGKTSLVLCPFERRGLGNRVEQVQLCDRAKRCIRISFDPPIDITSDGAARVVLAKGELQRGQTYRVQLTVDLPEAIAWYPSVAEIPAEPNFDQWYVWKGTGHSPGSLIGLEDWIERPAGKAGRIVRRGDKLYAGDRPIKLWGINLCYSACAPDKDLAERRAAFYPRYGINSVRLHKFADGPGWAGIQAPDSCVEFDPAALDRMDYQVAKFKEAGLYIKLSAHFGVLGLGPADKQYVPYLEEFGPLPRSGERVKVPHSAVHYSPELQQVHILQMVRLLQHRNPYTGLTYAEDPVVAFVEIINEQSILFYTSMDPLKASPTLRQQVGRRFCDWLRKKYGTPQRLAAAWGERAFNSFASEGFSAQAEHLDQNNILPLGNPWFWDPNQLNGSQAFRKQRLLDTLEFLYSLQGEFYQRYLSAVRQAGYTGELVASNWQAGRAFSHFANLHSDSLVGTIDRHNYFGSDQANASMLMRAGSGILSSGMQQVAERPFMLSEWIHVFPNQMGVEGPAIIGAYGMGLQGWDVSYMFQNRDEGTFSSRIGRDRWDVTAPQILGVFPAVARQVLRGDIAEADPPVVRRVHVPSLFEGRLGFDDRVVQGYDDKQLDSATVPAATLAVSRCVVSFTDEYVETPKVDLTPFSREGWWSSATRELRWRESSETKGGVFTVNTAATKAVVGFASGETFDLGEVQIAPKTQFAAIYVTARDQEGSIARSPQLLVVAMARAYNSGMKYSPEGTRLLAAGKEPIVLEPVKAEITIRRPGNPRVFVLDQDGCRTAQTLSVGSGRFSIDTGRDKTPYYLVEY